MKTCKYPPCNNKFKARGKIKEFCCNKHKNDFNNKTIRNLGKKAYAGNWERMVEWQDVKKKLPTANRTVLCVNVKDIENAFLGYWTDRRQCMLSTVAGGAGECGEGFNDLLPCSDVTHWLPIPELKEEE